MGNANETPPQSAFDQRLADLTPAIADAVFALSAFADTASRNERRKGYWRMAMYTVMSLMLLFAVIMNLHNLRRMWGPNSEPAAESIALISINGGIGQKDNASAESVIPLIEQACYGDPIEGVQFQEWNDHKVWYRDVITAHEDTISIANLRRRLTRLPAI